MIIRAFFAAALVGLDGATRRAGNAYLVDEGEARHAAAAGALEPRLEAALEDEDEAVAALAAELFPATQEP